MKSFAIGFLLLWVAFTWPLLGQDREKQNQIGYDQDSSRLMSDRLGSPANSDLIVATSRPMIELRNAEHVELTDKIITGSYALTLRGNVEVLVSDPYNNNKHLIRADEIVYHRDSNLLAARSKVKYTATYSAGNPQSIEAESLVFDLLNSSALFIDGVAQYHHLRGNQSSELQLKGGAIYWLKDRTMIIDDAVVTSSFNIDRPNYELRARRMWLLGLSDWALRDATFFLGRVPLFYLPYFFLPGDELLFNPVLGMKGREGLYLNTTLYYLGKQEGEIPSRSSKTSATDSDEQSVFFKDRLTYLSQLKNDKYVKFMFDLYSRLGFFTGFGAKFPLGKVGSIEFELGLARSRKIWDDGQSFWAYNKKTGRSLWHDSSLFGVTVPLRYSIRLIGAFVQPHTSITANLELFSDNRFVEEFLQRKENHTFPVPSRKITADDESEGLSNLILEVHLESDLLSEFVVTENPSVLIDRIRIDNAAVRWFWNSRSLLDGSKEAFTGSFYYPALLQIPVVGSVSGTLFDWPPTISGNVIVRPDEEYWKADKSRAGVFVNEVAPSKSSVEQYDSLFGGLRVRRPQLHGPKRLRSNKTFASAPDIASGRLDYDVRPSMVIEAIHDSSEWLSAGDINYSLKSVTAHFANTTSLKHSLNLHEGFFGLSNDLQHSIAIKQVLGPDSALNDNTIKQQIRGNTRNTLSLSNQFFSRPFLYNSAFYDSAIIYDLDLQVFSILPDDGSRDFQIRWGSWDVDGIIKHRLRALLSIDEDSWQQSLGIGIDLPPQPLLLNADLSLDAGLSSISAGLDFGCEIEELTLWTCKFWEVRPLRTNLHLAPFDGFSVDQELRIDLRIPNIERTTTSLQIGGLNTALTAAAMGPLQRLSFQQLKFDYEQIVGPIYFWRNRIRLEFIPHASWIIDFRSPTKNQFMFSTVFTMEIHEFLDLSFSTVTRNDHTYRYVKQWAEQEGESALNVLQDIWWSFSFWNEERRRASNFKIDRISLNLIHHLEDWDLSLEYALRPMIMDKGDLELISEFSVFLQWISVPEIQSMIQG